MPSTSNVDVFSAALDRTPEFTELAAQYGPFFFGVFLVLISVVLLFLNKNKTIVNLFSVCGVLFMVVATFQYSSRGEQIHAYTMTIDNLTKDDTLVLKDSPLRIFRHNRVYDTAQDSFSVDLLTVSPIKLVEGMSFNIMIKRAQSLIQSDGVEKISYSKYIVPIRFKGTYDSLYTLKGIEDEEEGFSGFQIVANSIESHRRFSYLESFFMSAANASDLSLNTEDEDNVEIIYFQSAIDKNKIVTALSSVGLRFGVTKSRMQKPANAVWVGKNVPSDVVKTIGESMLKQSIEIRYFGGFRNMHTKTNVVQIGYSTKNKNKKIVSKADIDSFILKLEQQKTKDKLITEKVESFNRVFKKKLKSLQRQQQ